MYDLFICPIIVYYVNCLIFICCDKKQISYLKSNILCNIPVFASEDSDQLSSNCPALHPTLPAETADQSSLRACPAQPPYPPMLHRHVCIAYLFRGQCSPHPSTL